MRLTIFTVALVAVLAACGSVREAAEPPRGDFTLQDAQAFDEFPLFYAGTEVDGLPLVAILRRNDTANYVSFVYGDCTPAAYDGGCAPPAEIQVWPWGARDLGSYDSSLPGAPVPEETRIRGLPAAIFDDGARLEIYGAFSPTGSLPTGSSSTTGRSTIVIFSDTRERVLAIARALRCVREPGPAAGEPPDGTLACQGP